MNKSVSKRFLVIGCSVLVFGAAAALLLHRYLNQTSMPAMTDKDFYKFKIKMGEKAPDQPQPAVASLDPKRRVRLAVGNVGLADEAGNRELGDLLTAELSHENNLELVDRQSLQRVLDEIHLNLSGLIRAKDAVRVGKLLRADWFLLGTASVANGTNAIVARIVDARTGVIRDAGFIQMGNAGQLSRELASFVRETRKVASQWKPKTYLAIGIFEDLSLNSRQAALPSQLRGYLAAAYQHTKITLLEREHVTTLLQEVHLDMAGLTEESANNASMQSAFWLVDGSYQSYETATIEVELALNIQQMFGPRKQVFLRERPGEALFQKTMEAIDARINEKNAYPVPSRVSEISAQLGAGKDLAGINKMGIPYVDWGGWTQESPDRVARDRRRLEEAMRAFETVLLLDPGNREARLCLAACLRHHIIARTQEARDYYRQIIESSVQDKWNDIARRGLWSSFEWQSASERAQWFESAAGHTTNSAAADFYHQQAKVAQEDAVVAAHDTPKAHELAEQRFLAALKQWEKEMSIVDFRNNGFGGYVESFGTNEAEAASNLVALLPTLQKENPNLAPHIMAGVVSYQVDTNAPIISEFERSLDEWSAHPETIFKPAYFFLLLSEPLYYWSIDHQLYGITVKILESRARVARMGKARPLDEEKKMALGFAYMKIEQWTNALEVFLSYSNRPVLMGDRGLWGRADTAVYPSRQANVCRRKAGLPEISDPREISIETPGLHFRSPLAFVADEEGVWLASGNVLLRLDMQLRTNKVYVLAKDPSAAITCLAVLESTIWIGTSGAGLIEFDKTTQQSPAWTESDGMLMNYVNQVAPARDCLWIGYGTQTIGYGKQTGGGLGRFDFKTRKFSSFGRSLARTQGSQSGSAAPIGGAPPVGRIDNLFAGVGDEVWFSEAEHLKRFRSEANVWEEFSQVDRCLAFAVSKQRIFAARYAAFYEAPVTGFLGLNIFDVGDSKLRKLPAMDGLPHELATAVALDGADVWVGGMGFVALVNPEQGILKKYVYISTRAVDRIQSAGGYVWVQSDRNLHRALLNSSGRN